MALNRPWFQPVDRPASISLHLFGYGPKFFEYLLPLLHPEELRHLNTGAYYYGVSEDHNNTLTRRVELGFLGLASHLVLFGAAAAIDIRAILGKKTPIPVEQKLAMAAVMAAVAGRAVEQLAGIPHISDEALFWSLLAVIAALPVMEQEESQREATSRQTRESFSAPRHIVTGIRTPVLQFSLAVALASTVLGFTLVKNINYALAESRATFATASLDDG